MDDIICYTLRNKIFCQNYEQRDWITHTRLSQDSEKHWICNCRWLEQTHLDLRYPQKILSSLDTGSSMPDHEIELKKGFIVILLRNILPKRGHVNGTRYVVVNMTNYYLFFRSVSGANFSVSFVYRRMHCQSVTVEFPVPGFKRCQFPIRVCFAMTINKAQGQSITGKLVLYLSYRWFASG